MTRVRLRAATRRIEGDGAAAEPFLDLRHAVAPPPARPDDPLLAFALDRGLPLRVDWKLETVAGCPVWWVGDRAILFGPLDDALWPALAERGASEIAVDEALFADASARVDAAVAAAPVPLRALR